jgi:SAM-dependent methyltransferase
MLRTLGRRISHEQFHPGLLGLLVNPFFLARRGLRAGIAGFADHITGSVLDVGCGTKPYRALFRCVEYVGLDTDGSGHDHRREQIDVKYDGEVIPFHSSKFDSAVCFQVLEHVFEPKALLREVHRVLKPGGYLLLTVPFVWGEHEMPTDCARYTSVGLVTMMERSGFEVLNHKKSAPGATALCQLLTVLILEHLPGKRSASLLAGALSAPMTVAALLLERASVLQNCSFYLDTIVLARKVAD